MCVGKQAHLSPVLGIPALGFEKMRTARTRTGFGGGMRIDVEIIDTVPQGVDTREDLARARVMIMETKP